MSSSGGRYWNKTPKRSEDWMEARLRARGGKQTDRDVDKDNDIEVKSTARTKYAGFGTPPDASTLPRPPTSWLDECYKREQ